MVKIYTKTGDDGTTGMLGNVRVRKDAARLEANGTLDEVNATLGVLSSHLPESAEAARGWLDAIQSDLFVVGTLLATPASDARAYAIFDPNRIGELEATIDQMEGVLKPLKNFILPQGVPAAGYAHLARAITRRAERRVVSLTADEKISPIIVPYLNRLSDFLFVLARWITHQEGGVETAWINSTGSTAGPAPVADRLGATLQKLEDEKQRRQTLFEKAASDLQKKKELAEKAFRQNVDQIKKDGGKVEKPVRDMDLD